MNNWLLWLIVGIVLILGGIFALMNPFAASVAAEQIAGWCFVFGGIGQLVAALRADGWASKILGVLLGIAYVWLGVTLLGNPLVGIITLTMMVAIMFVVNGVLKIVMAFGARGSGYFWVALLSGVLSVVLGVMVFGNFLQSSAVLLGVLLAIELISSGVTMVAFALAARKLPPEERGLHA